MKKTLLFTLLIASLSVAAQTKKDTVKKQKYDYFVKVQVNDLSELLNIATDYRRLITYDNQKPDQLIQAQKGIDAFLADIRKRLIVDSVKVEGKKP